MLRKIIFFLFAVVIGLPLTATGQGRNVVWVHGLGGDASHWENFRNQFNGSHRINGFAPVTFNSGNGIQTFADGVDNNINGRFQATTRPIAIAHSMGGAALRRLDFARDLGGIITVGSPLDGAGIATAINNGSAAGEIQNGVNQVGRGPISAVVPIVAVLGIRVSDIIEALVGLGVIGNNPLSTLTSATAIAGSVNDLQLGGGITNDMNLAPTARPKISVFGNLSSPVHWKMATDALRFNGISNIDLATAASNAEDVYYTAFVVHSGIAVSLTVGGIFQPWLWFAAAIEYWKASEWKAGYDWLRDSERIWNVIIAADLPANQSQCFTQNRFVCSPIGLNFSNPACWEPVTTCVSLILTGKSDGFIPAGSQAGLNSPSWTGAVRVEAPDVSHFQELNTGNNVMQGVFEDIWLGNRGGYFRTERR